MKRHAPKAKHRRTGLHRQRALTTKPIERSHVPVKDRMRPMRSLGSIHTGQRLLEGVELAQAVRRGDIRPSDQGDPSSAHEGARLEVATLFLAFVGVANRGLSRIGNESRPNSNSAFSLPQHNFTVSPRLLDGTALGDATPDQLRSAALAYFGWARDRQKNGVQNVGAWAWLEVLNALNEGELDFEEAKKRLKL